MPEEPKPAQPASSKPEPRPPLALPPYRRPRWRWWILAVLLVAAGVWAYRRPRNAPPAAAAAPVTVTAATATVGSIPVYLDSIGTVTPVFTDLITAQVSGTIAAVRYREGQEVRAGTVLIEIDPRLYAAQVQEAEGALERDQQLLAEARMDLARYQQAWAHNAVSRQMLEDQEKLVLQDQGTVKNDQGSLAYAQAQLAYCRIAAPITGRVGLRLVDPGNLVTANATTPLLVITQLQPITVIFTLAEDDLAEVLAQMKQGPLRVEAWDRQQGKRIATGRLTTVDNQIDTTTGTVKLRAQFANADGGLFPNQFVNTRLLVKTLAQQTLLPTSAVQYNGTAAYVYVIQNRKAVLRAITTGVSEASLTSVQGVRPGEVVADSSFQKLQNGAAVAITTQPPPGGTGGGASGSGAAP